jgi:hypothetical protein
VKPNAKTHSPATSSDSNYCCKKYIILVVFAGCIALDAVGMASPGPSTDPSSSQPSRRVVTGNKRCVDALKLQPAVTKVCVHTICGKKSG